MLEIIDDPFEENIHALSDFINEKYQDAWNAKMPLTKKLHDCIRQLNGFKDEESDNEVIQSIKVALNITPHFVEGVVALVRDILGGAISAPYEVRNTVIPDLSPEVLKGIKDTVEELREKFWFEAGGDDLASQKMMAEAKEQLESLVKLNARKEAISTANAMSRKIEDDLSESNWSKAFGDFIYNFVHYPVAILKSGSKKTKKVKEWDKSLNKIRFIDKIVDQYECISPFDFFWSPEAQNIQDAEYVIEKRYITRNTLLSLSKQDGYDRKAILDCIWKNKDGFKIDIHDNLERPSNEKSNGYIYESLGFYGKIHGKKLIDYGMEVEDENDYYECEIWSIDNYVIYARSNPTESGIRPFYKASFWNIPHQFHGESITTRLYDIQKICTVVSKYMIANMGFSAGPMGIYNSYGMASGEDAEDATKLNPFTIKVVSGRSGSNQNPYSFIQVESNVGQLSQFFDKIYEYAFEILGIPRIAFGGTQGLGTIGRTSGGVAMVLSQTSKTLKFALRYLEEEIIEPVIQERIDWNLMYSDDNSIKGDLKVFATGVSGLIEKEQESNKLEWLAQSLAPWAGKVDPKTGKTILPSDVVLKVIFQIMQRSGINTDGILPDFEQEAALKNNSGQTGGFHPSNFLDSRSNVALNTINNA